MLSYFYRTLSKYVFCLILQSSDWRQNESGCPDDESRGKLTNFKITKNLKSYEKLEKLRKNLKIYEKVLWKNVEKS